MKNFHSPLLSALVVGTIAVFASGSARADDVFVTSNAGNSVQEIANGVISTLVPSSSDTLYSPTGLAVYGGNLFVANNGTSTIGTGYVAEFNELTGAFEGNYASNLNQPRGLTFDTFGNMYVANQVGGTITEIPAGGGPAETIVTGLPWAQSLTFDSAGNLYVTNSGNGAPTGVNDIEKISLTDGVVNSVVTFATQGLNNPIGLTYVTSGANAGNFFVVNNSNSVLKFDSAGNPVSPVPFISGLDDTLDDITVDSSGDFYVTDSGAGNVTEYDSLGNVLNTYSGFSGPCYVTAALVVPEPSTYVLLGAGLVFILFLGRRKAAKVQSLPIQN